MCPNVAASASTSKVHRSVGYSVFFFWLFFFSHVSSEAINIFFNIMERYC